MGTVPKIQAAGQSIPCTSDLYPDKIEFKFEVLSFIHLHLVLKWDLYRDT